MFEYKMEKELQSYIFNNFDKFFDFKLIDREYKIGRKKVDFVGEDDNFIYLVEVKRNKATKTSLEQLIGYMDKFVPYVNKPIKGIIAAPSFNSCFDNINIPHNISLMQFNNVLCNPGTVTFLLLLPRDIVRIIDSLAKKDMRSRSKMCAILINKGLRRLQEGSPI